MTTPESTTGSLRQDVVQRYFEGFRRSDHEAILALLADDVVWDLPGFRHLQGKAAFDGDKISRVEAYLVPLAAA